MPQRKKHRAAPLPRSIPVKDPKLAALQPTKETDLPIIGEVGRYLERRRLSDDRDQTCIHPSDISKTGWCPRSTYYRVAGTPSSAVPPSKQLQLIFEEGHNIHDKWQTWLWDMGRLEGVFECILCGWKHWAEAPRRCPRCKAIGIDRNGPRFLRYREVPLFSTEHMIRGHADGKLIEDGLIEIKSIGLGTVRVEAPDLHRKFQEGEWTESQLWSNIHQPFPSHLRQGWIYCYCFGATRIYYIYDWKPHSAVKVFPVDFALELIQERLDSCLDVAWSLDNGKPPRRPVWAEPTHKTCKECEYRTTCWEGEELAETPTASVRRRRRT